MKFHFIGTSAGSPTVERNVTSLAITFEQRTRWYMVDCGDGTQQRILRTSLSLPKLDKIFVTHMHGDHIYGLPGILTSRGLMSGADSGVEIYGPKGIKKFIETVLKLSYTRVQYPIKIHEFLEPGELYENDSEAVSVVALSHDIPSYAYVLKEKARPGTFDVEKAKAAGIPPGPLFGQLTAGKTITLEDGREFSGKDFIGPEKAGRTVIIGGDNESPELLADELKNACLLIHESTHTEEVRENLKWKSKHSTAKSVSVTAEKAGLKNLILTHFSPRFSLRSSPEEPHSIEMVQQEAESFYNGDLFLARDGDIYKLDRDEKITLDYRRTFRKKPSSN